MSDSLRNKIERILDKDCGLFNQELIDIVTDKILALIKAELPTRKDVELITSDGVYGFEICLSEITKKLS